MTPARLNVYFAFFPYGGNGGISSEHPSIRLWFAKTMLAAKADGRVGDIFDGDFSDTPITMTRNAAVQAAKAAGADVLVMCDSDSNPDLLLGRDALAKPFWASSFDFLYRRHAQGPVVVGCPYCGPPPCENVYVFRWTNWQSDHPDCDMRLEQFSREEAAARAGIEEVAALPTGLIMYDMRAFDLIKHPYFYYEWADAAQSKKASTEDVTNTRDIALAGRQLLGYNPIHCNWDAWCGHWKPKCVGKPKLLTTDMVNDTYRAAVQRNQRSDEKLTFVSNPGLVKTLVKKMGLPRSVPAAAKTTTKKKR